ncbi:DUF3995 domain-containing protein [Kitasatospora sp. NPDC088346]|uniref:DUF3995 domain-containing protein n=1 Tax=Kitasatospora sp. NPDC088346 TaxID=3364073 RepID=UPI00382F96C1
MKVVEWLLGSARAGRSAGTAEGTAGVPEAGPAVRAASAVAGTALAGIGALHVVWAVSPWPLGSREEFAAVVVGVDESQLPSAPLTLAVTGLLGAAAWLVVTGARPERPLGSSRLVRSGMWTVAGVLALRGVGGLASSGLAPGERPEEFVHWDLALHSPLCVALGGLTGYVAARTRRP